MMQQRSSVNLGGIFDAESDSVHWVAFSADQYLNAFLKSHKHSLKFFVCV